MEESGRCYIAIDLKSFYASVECVQRGYDPLNTNLVVADLKRTEKTICLAVTPSLKSFGIPGRPRLFEVVQRVRGINEERREKAPGRSLSGSSCLLSELKADPALAVDYHVAPPQMARYMQVSTEIYNIYRRYVSEEDIHVYSVDEVFMDVTAYLRLYRLTPRELAMKIIREVLSETGITATAGIGTNLYLCKVAMDIVAKHVPADRDGVRIAELDELSYREQLWSYRPLTAFWRVGRGTADRLEAHGMHTMGDVALMSVRNEELLYRLFGINAELLIDHAWGWEPCTVEAIHAYRPEGSSRGTGQVLHQPYDAEKAGIVIREMADALAMDLFGARLKTDQIVLNIGYDVSGVKTQAGAAGFAGSVKEDRYGRKVPKPAHGSINLGEMTSSVRLILDKTVELYEKIVDPELLIRRMYLCANHVTPADQVLGTAQAPEQLDMFTDPEAQERTREEKARADAEEERFQKALMNIRSRYGKNAVVRGTSFREGATGRERNGQIGGHKA